MNTSRLRIRRESAGRRLGFTLLEVVIALALSVLLLSAVYASLDLYWRYSVAGQDEALRSKLARSILRQIEMELRSVVYHDPASDTGGSAGLAATASGGAGGAAGGAAAGGASSTSSTGGTGTTSAATAEAAAGTSASSSSSSTTASTETEELTPDAALTTTTSGLFGDAYTLMMHVSRPSRTENYLPFADAQSAGGRSSDLQSVTYFVSGQGGGALQSMITSPGLARMAGDRLQMTSADQSGNSALLAAKTEILAEEVTSISFSYYDGETSSWLSSWDSTAYAALPRAVEIVLELKAPVIPGRKAGGSSATTVYRLTVAIPAAQVQLPSTE